MSNLFAEKKKKKKPNWFFKNNFEMRKGIKKKNVLLKIIFNFRTIW